jgi:hypothetical protein
MLFAAPGILMPESTGMGRSWSGRCNCCCCCCCSTSQTATRQSIHLIRRWSDKHVCFWLSTVDSVCSTQEHGQDSFDTHNRQTEFGLCCPRAMSFLDSIECEPMCSVPFRSEIRVQPASRVAGSGTWGYCLTAGILECRRSAYESSTWFLLVFRLLHHCPITSARCFHLAAAGYHCAIH